MATNPIEFRVLGAPTLRAGDCSSFDAVLRQPLSLALLTYLVTTAHGSFQSRDRVVGVFWPDRPERRARASLSSALWRLRKSLGPHVIVNRSTSEVGIDARHIWCDLVALEDAASQEDHARLLELYRGDLLGGMILGGAGEFDRWADLQRGRLARQAVHAAATLLDRALSGGDAAAAFSRAELYLELAPHDEAAVRGMMRTELLLGRPRRALTAFHRFRESLRDDLQVEPSVETQSFASQIESGLRAPSVGSEEGARGVRVASIRDHPRTPRTSRTFGAPHPPRVFVGRSTPLQKIRELLLDEGAPADVALEGPPGVGKTALAARLVSDLAREGHFFGGIYWLHAEHEDLVMEWARLGRGLGFQGAPEERAAAVLRQIAGAEARVLVVLDGAGSGAQFVPIPPSNCQLLVTTRRRSFGGARFVHRSVGSLEEGEVVELFESIAGIELGTVEQHRDLTASLDGHPLATELAGVYLKESAGAPSALPYLLAMRQGGDHARRLSELTGHGGSAIGKLASTFEAFGPKLRGAWLTMARFEPRLISTSLLEASGIDEEQCRGLAALHVVELERGGVRMHRPASDFGRRTGSAGERTAADESYSTGLLLHGGTIDWHTDGSEYLDDRPHFEVAVATRPSAMSFAEWSEFLYHMAFAESGLRMFRKARTHLERALAVGSEHVHPRDPFLGLVRSELAVTSFFLGDIEAAESAFRRALDMDLGTLGPDHPNIGLHLDCLAAVHSRRRQFRAAEALYRRVLDIEERGLGTDHPRVFRTRSNLAVCLRDQGDYGEARQLLKGVLDDVTRTLGEAAPLQGFTVALLSSVHRRMGEERRARDLAERAIDASKRLPGQSLFRHAQSELCGWAETA